MGYHPPVTHDDQYVLKEERQAAAMRKVAELGELRAELRRQTKAAQDALSAAVIEAVRLDAPRRRTQDLAQVGAPTFYKWLEGAGIETRPKKRPAR